MEYGKHKFIHWNFHIVHVNQIIIVTNVYHVQTTLRAFAMGGAFATMETRDLGSVSVKMDGQVKIVKCVRKPFKVVNAINANADGRERNATNATRDTVALNATNAIQLGYQKQTPWEPCVDIASPDFGEDIANHVATVQTMTHLQYAKTTTGTKKIYIRPNCVQ
tara:strand:- start:1582 stop:2073 length:492 start_codon:yes stop_codon:yes gene_type:complete